MEESRSVAIIGDNPEALLLSILHAEAGIPNYLVGAFGEDGRTHANRPGIEETLWLLDILTRSGKIWLRRDHNQISPAQVRTWIFSTHASNPNQVNSLELTLRKLAPQLAEGSTVTFSGLCRPHYTSTVLKQAIEQQSGLKVGYNVSLYYLPLFWTGERLQEFKEKPKVLAQYEGSLPSKFQEELLRVFPTLSLAPTLESAEASGLFSSISHEVTQALGLEFARMSEMYGINYDEVLDLCKDTSIGYAARSNPVPGRESIGTGIALSYFPSRNKPRLARAAHSINEDYQRRVVEMVKRALSHCGYAFRRSRVAILGTDGLLKNAWSRPESPSIIQALRKRGADVSLYPGENGSQPWASMVGEGARVENSLLRAVSKANCAIVALPKTRAWELDTDQLAAQMNRPGAICDLTGVLEASNVERSGLFYTTIGRGTLDG
jgi:UDP-N-acetyl-D-mannosaminuronate dehydrogenase